MISHFDLLGCNVDKEAEGKVKFEGHAIEGKLE